jgi:pimeloyl-ACP methyl ester carboxylesterase
VRVLYLHGFASGPRSTKGLAFERHFAARGVTVERLDLRVPSLEHLRFSAMLEVVRAALGAGPAVVIGSSLGGLCAARTAALDDRVRGLVLLAPAFGLAKRWREQLGPEWDIWKATGWRAITDYTTGQPARIDFGFVEELGSMTLEMPSPVGTGARPAAPPNGGAVRSKSVPTLILHGTRDEVVPIASSRAIATRRDANVDLVELDDTHELIDSLPTMLARTEAFLDQIAQ